MAATVDQNATTEESEPGTTDSFHNRTTEEAQHRITLKYNHDLRTDVSSRFTKSVIVKNIGDSYIFGRGIDSDILLNDSKMPRTFVSIVSRMKKVEEGGVDFFLKNCTTKRLIPFRNHQKDTQNIGPNEERELQNGTKFKLRDVTFTFYIEYGDLDSTRVELEVFRLEKLGTDTDPSWYEHVGSARPPRGGNPGGHMEQVQAGLVFPRSMPQHNQVQEPPHLVARGHAHSTPVFGNVPSCNYSHLFQGPYSGAACIPALGQGQYSTCTPSMVPGQYPTGPPPSGPAPYPTCVPGLEHRHYSCQPQHFVNPVVYGYGGLATDTHPGKTKSAFSPSPSAEVGLRFPFPPNTMTYDTCQYPFTTPSAQMQQFNQTGRKQTGVNNHVDYQQGIGEPQSQARVSLDNTMSCLHCQGMHCSQQTTCDPGPMNCWGSVPMNEVPRGPPLDSLRPDFISGFSAMRLQSPNNESHVEASSSENSSSRRVPTEHADENSKP